jgi:P-type Cu2+ transporter
MSSLEITHASLRPVTPGAIASGCVHCGSPLSLSPGAAGGFCCAGCRTVHSLISAAGLERYYSLRDGAIAPPLPAEPDTRRDRNWLEPLTARLAAAREPIELEIKLSGLRCVACIWLIQELFSRQPGAQRVLVNSARGSATLCVDARFSLAAFVDELAAFGYAAGPHDGRAPGSDDLLLRTGVALALGGNAMMYAAAIYFGLNGGPLHELLHGLNFACATIAVLIGAPVFMRSAWQALRRGILHLDLPIAVGIALSYAAALWSFATGQRGAAYYDSLAAFIALMLLGRWLKERIVDANQKQLLADDGVEQLLARRIEGGAVRLVPALELRAGDELLVAPCDLVPVEAELLDRPAACSLDWISGESEPVSFARSSRIPAGAFNAEAFALRVRATSDFAASALTELLGKRCAWRASETGRGHLFSLVYVIAVLLTAAGGFALWFVLSGSIARGLEIATAICVVTCPCAIGIAAPLAEDLVLSGLRRAGLFVRDASFLDRALSIRRIVFDKTGTLTTGRLHVENAAALAALAPEQRDVLYTLVAGSVHPKSVAVARALADYDARLLPDLHVVEQPGDGLRGALGEHEYRLGRLSWALPGSSASERADLVFAADGRELAAFRTAETLRADAKQELDALRRDGQELWILSGDSPERARTLGAQLGLTTERALGGLAPRAKADWIEAHDRKDLLMIGDGINDSLAVQQAFASGTPSIDRGFMPWRSDFYFVTPGLAPIRLALRAARRLAAVVRHNQAFAVAYNLGVVALALAGWMRPWLAAVLMPASSIVVLVATSLSLSARSSLWKS